MRRWGRAGGSVVAVVALAFAGVVLPTVTLPQPAAHAVAPDVDVVTIRGVDAGAKRERGALSEAIGATHGHGASSDTAAEDAPAGRLAALSARRATQEFLVAGVTWDADSGEEVTEVAVRLRENGRWGAWQALGVDGVVVDGGRAGTEPVTSAGADGVQARVRTVSGRPPGGLRVDVVDPGTSRADANVGRDGVPAASASAGTGFEIRPRIVTRDGWGADESLAGSWPQVSSKLEAIYVHHTAGTNSYSEGQSAALVRGIYAYHTRSRDWPDIGYQFLVDKYGNIFQGRRDARVDNPVGAQAGGYNTGTIGVAAMGNFDTARPSSALISALTRVIAWKAYQYEVYARGTATLVTGGSTGSGTRADPGTTVRVPRILMHKTTNVTACPGRYLEARMSGLRSSVEARRQAAIDRYGPMRWAVAAPTRYDPTSAQTPVQWNATETYRWRRVSGARYYQVLERRADWNSDMPSALGWRVIVPRTTATSVTVSLPAGQTRRLAVRAISSSYHRGPVTHLVRNTRQVSPSDWRFTEAWEQVRGGVYRGGRAYRVDEAGETIQLRGAREVKQIKIRAATNPADGRVQVRVGSTVYGTLDLAQPSNGDRLFTVRLPRVLDGTVTLRSLDEGKQVRITSIALVRW